MGIVYILECHTTGDKYIGSTMTTLGERYRRHKSDKSCVSRYIIEGGNHSIRELEIVETIDRIELEIREQYWMDKIPNINHKRAYSTDEHRKEQRKIAWMQYYKDNAQSRRDEAKKYYYDNYERVQQGDKRRKAWRRSWKADARMGFYNDMLAIDMSLFD